MSVRLVGLGAENTAAPAPFMSSLSRPVITMMSVTVADRCLCCTKKKRFFSTYSVEKDVCNNGLS